MNRWYATAEPQQHMLTAVAACAFGTSTRRPSDDQNSKPPTREAPTSA